MIGKTLEEALLLLKDKKGQVITELKSYPQ